MDEVKKTTDAFVVKMLLGDATFKSVTENEEAWKATLSPQARFGIQLLRTVGNGLVGPFVILSLAWKVGVHTIAIPMHLIAIAYQFHTGDLSSSDITEAMTKENFKSIMKAVLNTSFELLSSAIVSALVYGTISTAPVSLPIVTGGIVLGLVAATLLVSHIDDAIEEVKNEHPNDPIDWASVAMKVGEKSLESLQGAVAACIVGVVGGSIGALLFPLIPGIPSTLAPSSIPMAAGDRDAAKPSIDPTPTPAIPVPINTDTVISKTPKHNSSFVETPVPEVSPLLTPIDSEVEQAISSSLIIPNTSCQEHLINHPNLVLHSLYSLVDAEVPSSNGSTLSDLRHALQNIGLNQNSFSVKPKNAFTMIGDRFINDFNEK